MAQLFESVSINEMKLRNRFVRSATWEGLAAPNGLATNKLTAMMVELARGEVGLIISSYAFVSPDGRSSSGQLAAHSDDCVDALQRMAKSVHDAGGKIALQIVHGGVFSAPQPMGGSAGGPSAIELNGATASRALTIEEIQNLCGAFTAAAVRAKGAGFDAVQLHGAHGFLLSEFLSPYFNKRTDEYGGLLENRARFLLEVVRSIRSALGPHYPILVKLNSEDFLEGGMTLAESVRVGRLLEQASVDAIELSGGTVVSPEKLTPPRPGQVHDAFYREAAKLYKQQVNIPLILVGGIRTIDTAEELVSTGTADLISLSRPLVCEPNLVKRWRFGDRTPSACGSCNSCFEPASSESGIYCVTMERKHARVS